MLDFLKTSNQITNFETNVDLIEENLYATKLIFFLREIPPNFLSFYNKRTKRQEVERHLKAIYGLSSVEGQMVDIVLKRVINLARILTYKRSDIENKLMQSEYKRLNWKIIKRCQICGLKFKSFQDVSLEHVLPLSLGGTDDSTNWQLLCKKCNNEKASLFGISAINRATILSDFKIYSKQSIAEQLNSLPNVFRYLTLERCKRKCHECENDNTKKQLYVTIRNKNELVSFDNLHALCEVCVKAKNITKTETL